MSTPLWLNGSPPSAAPAEQRRRTARISRSLALLRAHGLLRKAGAGTVPLSIAGVTCRGPVDGRDVRLGPWIRGR
jgi:hypothetical protein